MSACPSPLVAGGLWVRVALMTAALWWGVLSGIAFVAVPALFVQLGAPAVAGPVAAWLFSFVCKLSGIAAILLLIIFITNKHPSLVNKRKFALYFLTFALVAAGLQDAVVAQKIITARATGGDVQGWHRLGSLLVFIQWAVAGGVLWRLTAPSHTPRPS